jgi:hypothetical protein
MSMTDPNTRDEAETYSHFEYVVGPAERSAFANGCASRDSEVATLSRQLAEARAELDKMRAYCSCWRDMHGEEAHTAAMGTTK